LIYLLSIVKEILLVYMSFFYFVKEMKKD